MRLLYRVPAGGCCVFLDHSLGGRGMGWFPPHFFSSLTYIRPSASMHACVRACFELRVLAWVWSSRPWMLDDSIVWYGN